MRERHLEQRRLRRGFVGGHSLAADHAAGARQRRRLAGSIGSFTERVPSPGAGVGILPLWRLIANVWHEIASRSERLRDTCDAKTIVKVYPMKPWMIWDIEREREERENRERANEAERAIYAPPPPPPVEPERREETETPSKVRAASLQLIGVSSIGER